MTINQSILGGMATQRAQALSVPDSASADMIDLSGEFLSSATTPALRAEAVHAIEHHLCDHYTRRPGLATLCRTVASSLSAADVPLEENLVTIAVACLRRALSPYARWQPGKMSIFPPQRRRSTGPG